MNAIGQTVFVVDDDVRSRDSLSALLTELGVRSQTFSSAEEFLGEYEGQPGCLITDLCMLGASGIELMQLLRHRDLSIPTIVITAFAEVPIAVEAMQAGAVTLLEKPFQTSSLWSAITESLRRDTELRTIRDRSDIVWDRIQQLSEQERAILDSIVDGVPNKRIAIELDVSIRTIENRRRSIFEKLQVQSVARLVQDVMTAREFHTSGSRGLQTPDVVSM